MFIFSSKYIKQFYNAPTKVKVYSFIFVLVLFGILRGYIYIGSTNKYTASNWRKVALNLAKDKPQYVFIGSSRFYSGIDPLSLPSPSYILSLPSADVRSVERILKANWENIQHAKKVFIEINIEMMMLHPFKYVQNQFGKLEDQNVSTYFWERLIASWNFRTIDILAPNLGRLRLTPRNLLSIATFYKESTNEYMAYGLFTKTRTMTEHKHKSSLEYSVNFSKENIEKNLYIKNIKAFRRIIKFLNDKNKEFALLQLPTYPTYDKLKFDLYKFSIKDILRDINQSVEYIVFEDNKFDRNDFSDVNHLNLTGAKKFSDLLKQSTIKN